MIYTQTIDARTGERKCFWLTECGETKTREAKVDSTGNWPSQIDIVRAGWRVRWNRARYPSEETDMQHRNFVHWESADAFRKSLKRRGYRLAHHRITVSKLRDGDHIVHD